MEGKGGEENLESPSVLQPHSRLHPAQREEEERGRERRCRYRKAALSQALVNVGGAIS